MRPELTGRKAHEPPVPLRRRNLWLPGLDLAMMFLGYGLLGGGLFFRQ